MDTTIKIIANAQGPDNILLTVNDVCKAMVPWKMSKTEFYFDIDQQGRMRVGIIKDDEDSAFVVVRMKSGGYIKKEKIIKGSVVVLKVDVFQELDCMTRECLKFCKKFKNLRDQAEE
ncbi:MAG: hypothetical protein ABH881_04530 [bacterium]